MTQRKYVVFIFAIIAVVLSLTVYGLKIKESHAPIIPAETENIEKPSGNETGTSGSGTLPLDTEEVKDVREKRENIINTREPESNTETDSQGNKTETEINTDEGEQAEQREEGNDEAGESSQTIIEVPGSGTIPLKPNELELDPDDEMPE